MLVIMEHRGGRGVTFSANGAALSREMASSFRFNSKGLINEIANRLDCRNHRDWISRAFSLELAGRHLARRGMAGFEDFPRQILCDAASGVVVRSDCGRDCSDLERHDPVSSPSS